MKFRHCRPTLLGSSGLWDSFSPLPHCYGAVGTFTSFVHCHLAKETWAVGLLQ